MRRAGRSPPAPNADNAQSGIPALAAGALSSDRPSGEPTQRQPESFVTIFGSFAMVSDRLRRKRVAHRPEWLTSADSGAVSEAGLHSRPRASLRADLLDNAV